MSDIVENLADKINRAYAESATIASDAKERAVEAVQKAFECGSLMLQQKEILQRVSGRERPGWVEWLAANCPEISEQTARRYMALAKRSHVSGYLEDCSTLRQAYLATGILKPAPKNEPSTPNAETPWVRYTKPLDQFRLWFNSRVEDTPIERWDEDMLRILSNELKWFVNLYGEIQRVRGGPSNEEAKR